MFLARYYLNAGNFDKAILNANLVSKTIISKFNYDSLNLNPLWVRGSGLQANSNNFFQPRDNFGLPSGIFTLNLLDGRITFFTAPAALINVNLLPCESLKGFYATQTTSIPL